MILLFFLWYYYFYDIINVKYNIFDIETSRFSALLVSRVCVLCWEKNGEEIELNLERERPKVLHFVSMIHVTSDISNNVTAALAVFG